MNDHLAADDRKDDPNIHCTELDALYRRVVSELWDDNSDEIMLGGANDL